VPFYRYTKVWARQRELYAAKGTKIVVATFPAAARVDREYLGRVRDNYVLSRPFVSALANLPGASTIICGRDDHWTGFLDAATWTNLIPHCDLHVIADAGPLLMLEQPAAFTTQLRAWLSRQ
jgi:pimeloyl-ACP methyl ester carboxylesterase